MELSNKNSLDRFIAGQDDKYCNAYSEIKRGFKYSCWMWYIFPILRELGYSKISNYYGIIDLDEAREYLAHPILGKRLVDCCEALLVHTNKTAEDIFGAIDDLKLQSSMTLFSLISEEGSIFHRVLDQFFDGVKDEQTLNLLK
ncbi:MAG: DUF1810 domain-containing protein [Clostridia bacterium]|nr:DUF1810 domain-containing protein [Clostridia bacterium]